MKNFGLGILILVILQAGTTLKGQSFGEQRSIQMRAQKEPGGGIRLIWKTPPGSVTSYSLRKKLAHQPTYGAPMANLQAGDTTFLDTQVQSGDLVDYVLVANGTGLNPASLLRASLEAVPKFPGGILAVLDTSMNLQQLQGALDLWEASLMAEGWQVYWHFTHPNDSVPMIRQAIQTHHGQNPQLTHVVLLGRVPVPYSGNIAPDAHPDHQGAWPADNYYAELFGTWTDQTVQNTVANSSRNHNVPGDGKFDQSVFPAQVDLALGRIDFHNMPAFGTQEDLMARYFQKNYLFRTGQLVLPEKGIVDDHFASYNEGFSAPGWRGFPTLFAQPSTESADYFTTGLAGGALWGYGCGAGSYTSASGIGNSNGFASDSLAIVFNMLFGSYFGDWDNANAFLRAPLASKGLGLTNIWAGRPYAYVHYMGSGSSIGEAFLWSTHNPDYSYGNSVGLKGVHMALMGDPSLRLHHFSDMGMVQLSPTCDSLNITWSVGMQNPPHLVQVGVSDSGKPFQEVGLFPYGSGQGMATIPNPGHVQVMVRPLYLKSTGSGDALFPGGGYLDSVWVDFPVAQIDSTVELGGGNCPYTVIWTATGGLGPYQFHWTNSNNLSDTSQTNLCAGTYYWHVQDANGCTSKIDTLVLQLPVGIAEEASNEGKWFPNPFGEVLCHKTGWEKGQTIQVKDIQGRVVWEEESKGQGFCIQPQGLQPGVYLVQGGGAPERVVFVRP